MTEFPATVTDSDTVEEAIQALNLSGCGGIPVFGASGAPVGWVTYRDALRTVSQN